MTEYEKLSLAMQQQVLLGLALYFHQPMTGMRSEKLEESWTSWNESTAGVLKKVGESIFEPKPPVTPPN